MSTLRLAGLCLIAGLSIYSYSNSLEGELCFDDMFALLHNGDTAPDTKYWQIWGNDFWGHNISTNQSHKSYRPVTITYFRLIRMYSLHQYYNYPNYYLINNDTIREQKLYPEYIYREKDLQPRHLHIGSVTIHTINSILISILVWTLFNHRPAIATECGIFSGLLFAVHPIHTEAVSGIVGAAELLCCMFGILSFLAYVQSFDIDFSGPKSTAIGVIWTALNGLLFFASALSKEGGVTVSALMIAYACYHLWRDILLHLRGNGSDISKYKYLYRFITPIVWLSLYLALRKYLAEDVMSVGSSVFRRTENPIAFEELLITRVLSTMFVHFHYLWLLIWPHPLSADYSFNCIHLITTLLDPRNVISAICYATVLIPLLMSLGRIIYSAVNAYQLSKSDSNIDPQTQLSKEDCISMDISQYSKREWIIVQCLAWLIIPFFPASNMFFYVATFIAERLLYLPSVGFCIIIGMITVTIKDIFVRYQSFVSKLAQIGIYCIYFAVIALGVYLTRNRNLDWDNEETLFRQAYTVCPDSVKVLQNHGILDRRYFEMDKAMAKFKRAKEIDPTFCALDHWLGITLINQNSVVEGIENLKESLLCGFGSEQSAQSLHKLFELLFQYDAKNAYLLNEWGNILHLIGQNEGTQTADQYLTEALGIFVIHAATHAFTETGEVPKPQHPTQAAFENQMPMYDRMSDIVSKLDAMESNSDGNSDTLPLDCVRQWALFLVDFKEFRKRLSSLTEMHSKYAHSRKRKQTNTKLSTTIEIFESKITFLSRQLAQELWAFVNSKTKCRQEIDNVDHQFMIDQPWRIGALNILNSLFEYVQKRIKDKVYITTLSNDEEQYWLSLFNEYLSIRNTLNTLSKHKPKTKQESIQIEYSNRQTMADNVGNTADIDMETLDLDSSQMIENVAQCEQLMRRIYAWMEQTLKQKSTRETHFIALMESELTIRRATAAFKRIVESNLCGPQTKIWALDGIAIVLVPYVDKEKNNWNFEGLLERYMEVKMELFREGTLNMQSEHERAIEILQWVATLYPYTSEHMNKLTPNINFQSQQ